MNLIFKILLIIVCVMAVTGCLQQESKVTPVITPTLTPTSTPYQEVEYAGHCILSQPLGGFKLGYNTRDVLGVVETFNESALSNHSVGDVRGELEFAEEHDVFIVQLSSVSGDEVDVVLDVGGKKVSTSVNFSIRCIEEVRPKPSENYRVVARESKITNWVFDGIRRAVQESIPVHNYSATAESPE